MWSYDLSCMCMPSGVHGLLLAPCSPHTQRMHCVSINLLDTLTVLPLLVSRTPPLNAAGFQLPAHIAAEAARGWRLCAGPQAEHSGRTGSSVCRPGHVGYPAGELGYLCWHAGNLQDSSVRYGMFRVMRECLLEAFVIKKSVSLTLGS
jgi:hypothetical protein